MLYAKSTNGFYDKEIHGDKVPSDAVEIPAELHAEMLTGQSQGKCISADNNGFPILIDAPVVELTYAQKRAAEYPSFADQFDILYHGGYEAWRSAIESVKNQFPKPQ